MNISTDVQRTFSNSAVLLACSLIAGCLASDPFRPGASDTSPSPAAGGSASLAANQAADKAVYKPVDYKNAAKVGPGIVVIPGQIKSNNATFTERYLPTNIADYAELELGRANFKVLERSDLGALLKEFELAYNLGDPQTSRSMLQKGKLKTTRWVVKFDILKAERVADAAQEFDGDFLGNVISIVGGGGVGSRVGGAAVGSVKKAETAGIWIVGIRYKVLDANTTEQVAQGYFEDKLEVGAAAMSVAGFTRAASGGVTLDTMVQRLVQQSVAEIDAKHK